MKKDAASLIYILIFMVILILFSGFAIDAAIVYRARAVLQNATESTALNAVTVFQTTTANTANITTKANTFFNIYKQLEPNLAGSQIEVEVNEAEKEVRISATTYTPPFFLGALGISKIKLKARAAAKAEDLQVNAISTGIKWATQSAVYNSDIVSTGTNLNDTAVITPLGDFVTNAIVGGSVKYQNLDVDGQYLNLGPGGFITIKLPSPIINKPGYELYIKEVGTLEGYLVFAGLDKDPSQPYVNMNNQGGGIAWVDITCAAKSSVSTTITPIQTTTAIGTFYKMYGSAYFNINDSCIQGPIYMAKYLRIVDDNSETGYVQDSFSYYDNAFYRANLYGEASSATAGVDIDLIKVLNHVKLINPENYTEVSSS